MLILLVSSSQKRNTLKGMSIFLICETLDLLGLRTDVDTLLNNLGLHYLVHYDFLIYDNLTLEFLCTLEVKLLKVPNESSLGGTKLRTTGTLRFWMRNSDFKILVETSEIFCTYLLMGRLNSPNHSNLKSYGVGL